MWYRAPCSRALDALPPLVLLPAPTTVGQPQDVGLIFLSAMATSVAEIGREEKMEPRETVGTALLTLTLATTLVGVLTYLVARYKLATLVQVRPLRGGGGPLTAGPLTSC